MNQPPTTGTAIGTGAGDKTPNQPSSSVAPAPFTNLGSYLAVNAPQIQGMAEKVSGQLGQTYETAKGAVDTGAQAIQNQIAGGYAAPNQALVEQAAANPTEFAATPENVAAFQAQYGNKYTGPATAEVTPDYTTTQGAVQKAVNDAANLGNYGGLQSYLTTNLGTNPTQAISALDTALLNQSPEAIQQINTAAQRFPGLTDYFNQMLAQQNQNIAGAQTAAQTGAQAAQNIFTGEGGVIPSFKSGMEQKLAKAQADADKYNADLARYTNFIGENQAVREALNPSLKEYGMANPFDPIPAPLPNAPTQSNVVTAQDYAKQKALEQLMGNNLGPMPIDQSTSAEAGTFNIPNTVPQNQDIAKILQDITWENNLNLFANRTDPLGPAGRQNANWENVSRGLSALYGMGKEELGTYRTLLDEMERLNPGKYTVKANEHINRYFPGIHLK